MSSLQPAIEVFPIGGYSFGVKAPQIDEDQSVAARQARHIADYALTGMRTTVEAVMLVQDHGTPHVLMLQLGNSFFKLPGDILRPGEDDVSGLKRALSEKLAPPLHPTNPNSSATEPVEWEVSELVGSWWRPHFDTYMYPYIPPHVTKPKEVKRMYLVQLADKQLLSVPKNLKLVAIPLFDLHENAARYGPQMSTLPTLLGRFNFIMG
ncbi:hypothetical protein HDU98_001157 [Podochytrium sp. JEL0797]|nr:hypothetical protein HDU98_001157 [Podochytrium sp. JEL0797]